MNVGADAEAFIVDFGNWLSTSPSNLVQGELFFLISRKCWLLVVLSQTDYCVVMQALS